MRGDLVNAEAYAAVDLSAPVRLNVNESPWPPNEQMAQAIINRVSRVAPTLNRYPSREFLHLREGLCDYLTWESGVNVRPDCIWAANGSNEVMAQIMSAFVGPDRTVMSFPPTYSMYAQYVRDALGQVHNVPRDVDFSVNAVKVRKAIQSARPSVAVISSPNNPTGTPTPLVVLDEIAAALRKVNGVLVVDEAYAEFRDPGEASALALLRENPNVIVTRTMSKAFGVAGLRLGYCAAHPRVIEGLSIVSLPYHLSSVTQVIAGAVLEHSQSLARRWNDIRTERHRVSQGLKRFGLVVPPSAANFLLVGRFADSEGVWKDLRAAGVLTRLTGPGEWLRVSIGTPEENDTFLQAVARILEHRREELVDHAMIPKDGAKEGADHSD